MVVPSTRMARGLVNVALAVPLAAVLTCLLGGCVPPNSLDSGPVSRRIVNDRWVHPEGLFSFRLTPFGYGSHAVGDSVSSEGGQLDVEHNWRLGLALRWGADARLTDEAILKRMQLRSPGASWVHSSTVDVDGTPAEFRAAWVPRHGDGRHPESEFGLYRLDAFAVFLRFEQAGVPLLLAQGAEVWQSGESKRKGLPFDFVATFLGEVHEHEQAIVDTARCLAFDDPALDWLRDGGPDRLRAPALPSGQAGAR